MTFKLPEPLSDYFAASNAHDPDGVAACFAANAVVHDERLEICGRNAIRAWAERTSRRYHHRTDPTGIAEAAGRTVVTARVTGDFPGSPIDLRFHFNLADRQITGLEIG